MKSIILLSIFFAITNLAQQVNEAWVQRYNGPGNSSDAGSKIAVDDDGNVYVTGSSYSGGSEISSDYATIKYNSLGEQQWEQRYNGPHNSSDYGMAIAVDGLRNVYVTGYSLGYATIKYNSAGVQQWVQRFDGGQGWGSAIAVDDAGNVYVTGKSGGNGTDQDYVTIKYNTAGIQQWVQRYNGPGNIYDHADAIAVDDAGNVYITGRSAGSGTSDDFATIKYNSLGEQQWVQRYNGPGNSMDWAHSIAVDNLGNVYVTGVDLGSTGFDYATIKYNSLGEQEWVQRYDGPGDGEDYANALVVDDAGNVYVTGNAGYESWWDYATIKYNTAGVQQWVQTYNGPGNSLDWAQAITVDNVGNVYITGRSTGIGTDWDYATIKYNSLGEQQWVQRYNGPGNSGDGAGAIIVDNVGNVYITGNSTGSGTNYDYATIKYTQGLIITNPNGGETFQVGGTYDITWNSSNVSNVKIDYTTDNGISWLPIIASTPSDGSYSWTIPNTPSTQCKVRITDVENPSVSDESDGVLQIRPEFPEINADYYAPNSVNEQNEFPDQIILEQSRLILGIRLFLNTPPYELADVKVKAYLNNVPINIQLNTIKFTLDNNGDTLIDVISPDARFLIYSNSLQENLIDANVKLVIEEIQGFSTDIQFEKIVSYYFAKNTQENKPFKLSFDSYKFKNLTELSWGEFKSLAFPYSSLMLLGELYAKIVSSSVGRCWGMSATAGKYFLDPGTKPYPGNPVYIWEPTDILVTNPITYAHINQGIFWFYPEPSTNYEAFEKLQEYFTEQKPSVLSMEKEDESIGHAVLATSMTILDTKANIRVYDSNYPYNLANGEGDGCFTYDVNTHTFNSSFFNYNYDRFDAFTGLVFDVNTNLISFDILTQKLKEYLFNNRLKQFSSSCPVSLMIKDSQGFKYGFDENGNFIDEIPGCSFLKVPADTISTDSVTVIYAPDGENYEVIINSYNQGSLLFATNQALGNNSLNSYYADNLSITPTTVVTFDENNPQSNLQVDYDGDGQTDSTVIMITMDNFCNNDSVQAGWNMVSLPYLTEQNLKAEIFPTASSSAFWFNGGYVVCDTLEPRKGYWIKFDEPLINTSCGQKLEDTIHIDSGWNMIGCINDNVPIGNIDTEPAGILNSNFFGYSGGYSVADTLRLGKGYWIKSNSSGIINLNQSVNKIIDNKITINENWGSITVIDNSSRQATLYFSEEVSTGNYQMPPLPPAGAFDARFESGTMVEDLNKGNKAINITGAEYPIRIRVRGTNIFLRDRVNGGLLNLSVNDGEEIVIYDRRIDKLLIGGDNQINSIAKYSLEQNYPNPFNPITTIKFTLANEGNVNLSVYNILGEWVMDLKNEMMKPGYYEVEFNASSLASGIYFYKLNAGDFVQTKKMILLK